jgi:hypothetical protein
MSELETVFELYGRYVDLKDYLAGIERQVKQHQEDLSTEMIANFFPCLLEVYKSWRPAAGEIAMLIDFEPGWCYKVEIRQINGYSVSANPVKQRHVNVHFELNPSIQNYHTTKFVLPMQFFDAEISHKILLREL